MEMATPTRHSPARSPRRGAPARLRRGHRAPVTREQVLRAAAALFRARGFERTTMQAIARAVGLTKASLYHHVRGKQALLYEILQHTLDRALPDLERIAAAPAPAADRLRAAVRLHILTLVHDRDNVACFIEEGRALAPEYREALVAWRDRYEASFRRIIADGIATGEFAPTDVRLAGFAILGMVNWVVRWYRPEGQHSADEIAAHFAAYATGALQQGPCDGAPRARSAGGLGP